MRFLISLALVMLANTALAQSVFDRLDKFYVGGGLTYIDANAAAADGESGEFTSTELIGGYKYSGYLGGEIRLGTGLRSESFVDRTNSQVFDGSIGYYGSVYWRPETANEVAKIYGLIGYTSISVDRQYSSSSSSSSESGLSYGGGVGFTFDERWNLNFEYRTIIDTSTAEFTAVAANVDYRF